MYIYCISLLLVFAPKAGRKTKPTSNYYCSHYIPMALRNKTRNSFLVEAPDKGWSWIVAISCCLINMLLFGTSRVCSLLYVAMIRKLNISRKEASLPSSLAAALRSLCGPLAGFLAARFGVRHITLTGGIFAAFGTGMCCFTHHIILITVFFGVLFGLGFCMGNTLLPVKINEYFDKYRATATGISFSGACLGSFVLPLFVEFSLREYDLSGTFLVLSAVLLNCVPLAMLLRKPSFLKKNALSERTPSSFTDKRTSHKNCSLRNEDTSSGKVNMGALNTMFEGNMNEIDLLRPAANAETAVFETTELPFLARQGLVREKFENNLVHEGNSKTNRTQENKGMFTIDGNAQFHIVADENSRNTDLNGLTKTNAFNPETQNECNSFRQNMTVFRNPMFILIALSRGLYGYTFVSIITILSDFAVDIGVRIPELPYILMSFSVGDFLGRISLGSLIDKGFMTIMQYTATFFLLQALSIASLAWATGFQYLVTTSFVYGICGAALMLSDPLLVAECIETKLQTIAIPSIHVFAGLLYFTIPKLIELFRDQLGSYVGLLYTMSAISLICAVTWFSVPFFMRHRSYTIN